ncbi:hypothetical protein GCM10010451_56920 [Streptomyces virens]|uniref:Uncharacterized protein n=1 Tax=Streptomyces virens TaxID=285572 RepID=A0ABP6Q0M6_9ACTN
MRGPGEGGGTGDGGDGRRSGENGTPTGRGREHDRGPRIGGEWRHLEGRGAVSDMRLRRVGAIGHNRPAAGTTAQAPKHQRVLGSVVRISAAVRCGALSTGPNGVRCVQLHGGGGRQRGGGAPARAEPSVGESATDGNAADARAGPRDPGMIRTTGPNP